MKCIHALLFFDVDKIAQGHKNEPYSQYLFIHTMQNKNDTRI
jgi:hypothetical protein